MTNARQAVAWLAGALLVTSAARADEPSVRKTGLGRRDGRLTISVGAQDLIQPEHARRLTSGFVTRVLLRVALYRIGQPDPVAQATRMSEIVYDLWDESYHVRRSDGAGPPVVERVGTPKEAIFRATALQAFPVAALGALEPGQAYRLTVRADLNPLSPELVQDVRRWLARPPRQGRLAPGDGFFGSVVSIFVNPGVGESERRVQFVSQVFVEPRR